jgi:hypothetical protein
MFVNGAELNEHLYRGPSIDASYQGSVHLASGFRGEWLKKLSNQKQELRRYVRKLPILLDIVVLNAMFRQHRFQHTERL